MCRVDHMRAGSPVDSAFKKKAIKIFEQNKDLACRLWAEIRFRTKFSDVRIVASEDAITHEQYIALNGPDSVRSEFLGVPDGLNDLFDTGSPWRLDAWSVPLEEKLVPFISLFLSLSEKWCKSGVIDPDVLSFAEFTVAGEVIDSDQLYNACVQAVFAICINTQIHRLINLKDAKKLKSLIDRGTLDQTHIYALSLSSWPGVAPLMASLGGLSPFLTQLISHFVNRSIEVQEYHIREEERLGLEPEWADGQPPKIRVNTGWGSIGKVKGECNKSERRDGSHNRAIVMTSRAF